MINVCNSDNQTSRAYKNLVNVRSSSHSLQAELSRQQMSDSKSMRTLLLGQKQKKKLICYCGAGISLKLSVPSVCENLLNWLAMPTQMNKL